MTNKKIIQQMYADFGQGNVPAILNALSDDIIFDTPGPSLIPWAGIRKGKSGAEEFFKQVGTSASYSRFEPHEFIEDGDKVASVGSADFTSSSSGKKGSSAWIMVWTLRDGKAVHVTNLWDTY